MAGLPAAPFINLLSPLRLKSKTDDWDLPGPRATAFFWCYVIRVCHTPYYEKIPTVPLVPEQWHTEQWHTSIWVPPEAVQKSELQIRDTTRG